MYLLLAVIIPSNFIVREDIGDEEKDKEKWFYHGFNGKTWDYYLIFLFKGGLQEFDVLSKIKN